MSALNDVRRDERGFSLAELLITAAILGLVMAAVLGVQLTTQTMFFRGENQAEAQQSARAAMLMEEDLRMAGYGCPDLGCPTPPPAGPQRAISAASATSITYWADTLNASTTLSAAVTAGAGVLPVVDASGINVNDRIYLNNGGTWETRIVTGKAGNNLSVAPIANDFPQGVQVGRPREIVYTFTAGTGTLSRDAGDGSGPQTLATGFASLGYSFYDVNDALISPATPVANPQTVRRILIQTTSRSALASGGGASTFQINTNVRPRNL